MSSTTLLHFDAVVIQSIAANWLQDTQTSLSVLRLDRLHPVISGNKWFKLQQYLADAVHNNAGKVGTFGGAYSNHIVATAFACRQLHIPCTGFIRGEANIPSHTLLQAQAYGMEIQYVSREDYRLQKQVQEKYPGYYWIPEGGYGSKGAAGAATILSLVKRLPDYTHIVAATGTGTMLAGLVRAAAKGQQVTGISVMKGNTALTQAVNALLTGEEQASFTIEQDYHFGGYAKHPRPLIDYMIHCWEQHQLPLDLVYTSKAFFATEQLIRQHTIPPGSNVLFIHSGGLQGNLSLPAGTIPFS
jgi:1-aminocyclopropane-1-carboxylate deaminase/D-cysteine desulfhydrase-like pyridoxal-dependent ACC family enzyme